MPPACTPEKPTARSYPNSDSHINREYGYVTPTREDANHDAEEDKFLLCVMKKLPKLQNYFKLHRRIGEGTFSAVFLASLRGHYDSDKLFAIKYLIPTTHPTRIQMELRCLQTIGGCENVTGVDLCMRENGNVVFVMPYMEHTPFWEFFTSMNAKETALYIKNLLKALRRVHSFGVIHRDVKPNNFLYDRKNEKFLLVDFGLAQVCSSDSPLAVKNSKTCVNPQKRKRDSEITTPSKLKDELEPIAKRPALQRRNLNAMSMTGTNVENIYPKSVSPVSIAKENILNASQKIKKSPFKSPLKNISTKPILKSPFKFTGLDLPPNHSQFAPKIPGQRRLFDDKEDLASFKTPKFVSSVSFLNQKHTSILQNKSKHIQENLLQDCKCYNKASVCTTCLKRKGQEAARAGTPGFRPPEVLLKFSKQSTAVDMWAVGVILLCILSRTYPFFRAPDDVTALAEIITLFGDEQLKRLGKLFGRNLTCTEKKPPLDLRKVCCRLRDRGKVCENASTETCSKCSQYMHNCLCIGTQIHMNDDIFPDSVYDLLQRLLDIDPYTRISAEDALNHPFLKDID